MDWSISVEQFPESVADNESKIMAIASREFSELPSGGSSPASAMHGKFRGFRLEAPRHVSKWALLRPVCKDVTMPWIWDLTQIRSFEFPKGCSVNDDTGDDDPPDLIPFSTCKADNCGAAVFDEEGYVCTIQDCSSRICVACWSGPGHRCSSHGNASN